MDGLNQPPAERSMAWCRDRAVAHLIRATDVVLRHQVTDPDDPNVGAFVLPATGMPTADHTSGGGAAMSLCLAVLEPGTPWHGDAAMVDRAVMAVEALRRLQRPTGLIDLPKVDFDSPPDTAFMVQRACVVLERARAMAARGDASGERLAEAVGPFVESAARGIVGKGFRTPNHRWVVCSALAYAATLIDGFHPHDYIATILAEGIDINEDGAWSERSAGIYDGVNNRAMRLMADHLDRPDLLDHARANLDLLLTLIEPDGTVLTALSRRQDHGTRTVPAQLIDSCLDLAGRDARGDYLEAAARLIDAKAQPHDALSLWWLAALDRHVGGRHADLLPVRPPETSERFYAKSGLWRGRTPTTSFAVMSDAPAFLTARVGDVTLKGVGWRSSYFHRGVFRGETFTRTERGVEMRYRASHAPPVGWDLPLNRPVRFDTPHPTYYDIARDERNHYPLPQVDMSVRIEAVRDEQGKGFDLHLRDVDGCDRVPHVIEFDFEPGVSWRGDGLAGVAGRGQALVLRGGYAEMGDGVSVIRVGPGDQMHALDGFLSARAVSDGFRVQVPFLSPVDRVFEVRWW